MAKTTIEIADGLFIRTKKLAAELRRPIRAIIESALRDYLKGARHSRLAHNFTGKLRLTTVAGGLPKELDVSSRTRLYEWVQKQKK